MIKEEPNYVSLQTRESPRKSKEKLKENPNKLLKANLNKMQKQLEQPPPKYIEMQTRKNPSKPKNMKVPPLKLNKLKHIAIEEEQPTFAIQTRQNLGKGDLNTPHQYLVKNINLKEQLAKNSNYSR